MDTEIPETIENLIGMKFFRSKTINISCPELKKKCCPSEHKKNHVTKSFKNSRDVKTSNCNAPVMLSGGLNSYWKERWMPAEVNEMKRIYLDNASTTPVDREVLQEMEPYFAHKYGNASSLHSFGVEAKEALEKSRERVAELIGAGSEEIIFTGSGTESDNMAIKGAAFYMGKGHIITSGIEHPAVMEACRYLEKKGFEITYLPVDRYGMISPGDVENAIKDDTILITIMHANNEIGTV
jgi:hypothetical protein